MVPFSLPMGYQTHMIVYGPGAYRTLDFVRYGLPLELGLWVVGSLAIPVIWPF
jgi:di/tricarboxylate transporter